MSKRKRVEARSRQANWQQVQLAKGNCKCCGAHCDINPRTGAHYKKCPGCRSTSNAAQAALMKRRRAAGRDSWTRENRP